MYGNANTQASAIGGAVANAARRFVLFGASKALEGNGEKINGLLEMVGVRIDAEKTGKAVAFGATVLQLGSEEGSASDFVLSVIGDIAAVSAGRQSSINEKANLLLEEEKKKALEQKQVEPATV